MAKKYITDHVLPNDAQNPAIVANAISGVLNDMMSTEGARFAEEGLPLYSNIAAEVEGATPDMNLTQWDVSQDDAGAFSFNISPEAVATFTTNSVVVVATWQDETQGTVPQEEGEPLKRLNAIYVLALPSIDKMRSDPKLRQYIDSLLGRDLLAKARSIAKKMDAGADGFTLVADPVGMFLASTASSASREAAFGKMFTFLQAYMLKKASDTVAALKARGDHANAGYVKATYSRSRLSRDTLKACLSSQAAAEHYFPNMVNKNEERGPRGMQWDNILRMLMDRAPKHKVKKLAKDDAGNNVLDGEGNKTYEVVAAPQSPAIFSYWLETRYQAVDEPEQEDITIDFGEVSVG